MASTTASVEAWVMMVRLMVDVMAWSITSCVLIAGVVALLDVPRRPVLPRAVAALAATAAGVEKSGSLGRRAHGW